MTNNETTIARQTRYVVAERMTSPTGGVAHRAMTNTTTEAWCAEAWAVELRKEYPARNVVVVAV